MPTIALLTANALCNNPRALKAATTLARSGYDVHVAGAWLEPHAKMRDLRLLEGAPFRFAPVFDCTQHDFREVTVHAFERVRCKAGNVLHGVTGWESTTQLGPVTGRLLARGRQLSADLFVAHSEPALYVAWRLQQAGRRVGVDMEDWFSEDLLPDVRRQRPLRLLRQFERDVLVASAFTTCPSQAMSEALAVEYVCQPPTVVYNAFALAERQGVDGLRRDRRGGAAVSLCWYSQTLGPGRGLEDLVAALPLLERDVEVHLRGSATAGMEQWIRSRLPERWQQRLFVHAQVPNDELMSRLVEHDIGFAGEMKYCRNKELTVSNKILHYLLGGLAVIASDTVGQCEVAVRAPGAIELYPSGSPQQLAKALDSLLGSPDRLRQAKAAALQAAERTFSWDRQEEPLLQAVAAALSKQPGTAPSIR
jgi:glycosyltransferase involved in cell wall biosynthesis